MAKRKKKNKEPRWLDWRGRGYYAVPNESVHPFPSDHEANADQAWLSACQHAMRGDFRYVPNLIKIVRSPQLFENTVAHLVGDAAPSAAFEPLRAFIASNHWDFELTFAWCRALSRLGRLADVPLLLDAFEANDIPGSDEQDIIPLFIADVIDDRCGIDFGGLETHASFQAYRAVVLEQCEKLAARYGGEALLWRGAPRSVRRVAEALLETARGGYGVAHILRHLFEASTGIDCSPMFGRDGFKRLQAAAIVEEFLDGPVDQFEDGRRYFFGHLVP